MRKPMGTKPSRVVRLITFGTILLSAPLSGLAAKEFGDIDAGRGLAEKWCSTCHVVANTQQQGASTGPPPSAAIARMKSTTPLSLRVFLQSGHRRMPDLHCT